ncbi:MAG: amino acid permease [Bradymonadales bacterium]|nr:amino acid permease [Bradymonadales bacterium]
MPIPPDKVQTGAIPRRLGLFTATMVVVASMIGTGVFTTTGLLLTEIGSSGGVLLAWLVGGVLALCGALSYGELAACICCNGGEYRFLSDIFHPSVGFVAGWVSLVVGFSAPIAASALAFGIYLQALVPGVPPIAAGAVLVVLLAALHASRVTLGAWVQNGFTAAKVGLILVFVVGAAIMLPGIPQGRVAAPGPEIWSPGFAVGLIFVAFAYSGWNGAAYLSGEIRRPHRYLPLALGLGTILVMLLYLGLNTVFLVGTDPDQVTGSVEIGHLAAISLFGQSAGAVLSSFIALALVSSVSAMIMVGPRVYEAMGHDYRVLRFLRLRPGSGGPVVSIALQAVLAILMLLTLSFDELLMYIGFTLSASAALTVAGVFVHRRRHPEVARPYRTWGYPVTPGLFILFAAWMIAHSVAQRPLEALLGAATIGVGLVLYLIVKGIGGKPKSGGSDVGDTSPSR